MAIYQNQPEAVIYIAPDNANPGNENPGNKNVAAHYRLISDRFKDAGIPFFYLPDLLTDKHFARIMDYHHPYLGNDFLQKNLTRTAKNPVLLYASAELDAVRPFELSCSLEEITKEQLSNEIDIILAGIRAQHVQDLQDDEIRYRVQSHAIRFENIDEPFPILENAQANLADISFLKEAFKLPKDLRKSIEEIAEAGYLRKLIEYLEEIEKKNRKFSRLKITSDHKIYLMDYGLKEVTMSPLPKALFLLFLHHPEGILFKELPRYRTELMNIYRQLSMRENPDKAAESIRRMTDPYDNSVNEKCSMIRAAFLKVIADDLAGQYYITGYRGEPKRILLNRELVIQEQ